MAEDATLESLLDLLRRLPPSQIQSNLNYLCEICPDYADDLMGNVDCPLGVARDDQAGKEFLCCDYNQDADGDSINFRSPWSNTYLPQPTQGPTPSSKLRQLEISLNSAFDTYRELYYEGGVSSVYLWDLDEEPAGKEMSFAGVVLMHKTVPITDGSPQRGTWDSLHVFECQERGRSAKYKLTSTVILELATKTTAVGEGKGLENTTADGWVKLSGSMTRQAEVDYPLTSSAGHIPNVGRMVEDMEIKLRNLLSSVYFGKTKDVINELRSQAGLEARSREEMLRAELAGRLGARRS